jgi:hypothetical protein
MSQAKSKKKKHTVIVKEDNDDEKLHHSAYLLTINTNKSVDSMNNPFVTDFKTQIKNILRNFPDYIVTNPGHQPDDSMIVRVKPFFEIGSKYHRLHCHVDTIIEHNSNIRIDVAKLSDSFGYKIDVKFVKGSNDRDRILRYLRKNQ